MKHHLIQALAAAALVGSIALPLAAEAQVGPGYYGYGYGPSSVINGWTAGIPLVTPSFGQAYGAPASAYYGYVDNYYGGYGSPLYYGGYPQQNYAQQNYGKQNFYPSTSYLNWVPQSYQYQPYYSGYNQPYQPSYGYSPMQQQGFGYGPVQQNFYGRNTNGVQGF
jgi:hypothetical protein